MKTLILTTFWDTVDMLRHNMATSLQVKPIFIYL